MNVSTKHDPCICKSDASYCKFGANRLLELLENFEKQIEGVIESEDIEYVHRMRVASRRTRAAMPLFKNCFPQKKFKKWFKEVKQVTKLLGEARDLDVQIAFVNQYHLENKAAAKDPVVELLLKSYQTRRASVQPTVVKGLKKLRDSSILTEMQQFFELTSDELQNASFVQSSVVENANWAISRRLDDFLAMEPYVHKENAVFEHHEMRIQTKWLRYTMETFAALYKNEFAEEIKKMKGFQDSLGEMHDCDVWKQQIPNFIANNKNKQGKQLEKSLSKFLEYVKEQRKKHYGLFVSLWENSEKTGFFEKLRETVATGSSVEDKIRELQASSETEIAVLADIHANLHALEAVIENAEKRGIKFFLNAGDSIGFGPFPNEVIELLHSKKIISVIGNFDLEVFQNVKQGKGEGKVALDFARNQVAGSCRDYLLSLPRELKLEIAGKKILMTHGSPESIDEHLYSDTSADRLQELVEVAKADVIITGHSHVQYVRELGGVTFVNPGSVGRPDDGKPQAAYAIIKLNPFSVELLRVKYDVSAVADALRKKGLPESFSQMLLRGVSLSKITKEDRQRKNKIAQNCREATKNCEKISKRHHQDTEHYQVVRKLALRLFDKLKSLHELGDIERCWLECAAILHDIGIAETTRAHNKKSMELILNDTRLLLTSADRRILASVARYHRKSFPKKTHYNLASLGAKTIQQITLLSGILRVADSLDYTHRGVVQNLSVKISSKRITVECVTSEDPMLEQQAFNKKKDLIETVLKRKMVLVWKQR